MNALTNWLRGSKQPRQALAPSHKQISMRYLRPDRSGPRAKGDKSVLAEAVARANKRR